MIKVVVAAVPLKQDNLAKAAVVLVVAVEMVPHLLLVE